MNGKRQLGEACPRKPGGLAGVTEGRPGFQSKPQGVRETLSDLQNLNVLFYPSPLERTPAPAGPTALEPAAPTTYHEVLGPKTTLAHTAGTGPDSKTSCSSHLAATPSER